MAKNNIPGSGPIKDAAKEVVKNNPMGEGAIQSPLSNLEQSLGKGNIDKSKQHIVDLAKTIENLHHKEIDNSKAQSIQSAQQIKALKEFVKISQDQIKLDQQSLEFRKKHNLADQGSFKILKDSIDLKKSDIKIAQDSIREEQKRLNLQSQLRYQRKLAHQDFKDQTRETVHHLRTVEDARRRSFGAHLVHHNFDFIAAAQSHGRKRMAANAPSFLGGLGGGDMGEFAGGAMALAGGVILEKLVGAVVSATSRMFDNSYAISDVYKGSGAAREGVGSNDFRERILMDMQGMGTTLEQNTQLLNTIRPMVGGLGGGTQYSEILRQGISQDRAFGSELGTGAAFLASMVRKSNVGSDDASLNKLSTAFAEALGRGRLVGLQEEMVTGISQLVEITRRSGVGGANPEVFANMIANLSAIGNKNLMGTDAAQAIAGFDAGLKNPQNMFASVIGPMAIRSVLQKLAQQGQINPNLINQNGTILALQAQGMGAQIRGSNGQMINLAPMLLPEMLKQGISMGGGMDDLTTLAMAHSFNLPFGQMQTMLENQRFIGSEPGKNIASAFGIQDNLGQSAGVQSFVATLFQRAQEMQKLTGSKQLSDAQTRAILNEVTHTTATSLGESQGGGLLKVFNDSSKLSPQEQTAKVLDFMKGVKTVTPEDETKSAIQDIKNSVNEIANVIVRDVQPAMHLLSSFLNKFYNGPGQDKNASKAAAALEQKLHPDTSKSGFFTRMLSHIHGEADNYVTSGVPEDTGDHANETKAQQTKTIADNKAATIEAARKAGVPEDVYSYIIGRESGFKNFDKNGNVVTNPDSHAQTIAQLMPENIQKYHVDPRNTQQALNVGAQILKGALDSYQGDKAKALIQYDGGGIHLRDHTQLKPETIAYLLDAKAAGVITQEDIDNLPRYLFDGSANAATPPQTKGEQAAATQRVGVDHNINMTVQNPSGQPLYNDSMTYNHQINMGSSAQSTAYKKTIMIGPPAP